MPTISKSIEIECMVSSCQGFKGGENREWLSIGMSFFWGWWKCSEIRWRWWGHSSANILKPPTVHIKSVNFVVKSLSLVRLFVTPWTASRQASLSFTISQSLLKRMSIESVMPSNDLILCHPFLLPWIFPSISVYSNESALPIRWPKNWSFSFSISPSNEYSGMISFRIDWFDCFSVQGILKSLLQLHSSKASVLWCSAFFTVQLPQPYMTTGKIIALTRQTFVGKAMSLLFNMLSWLVIAFLPRSKRLLISWLQLPSAVILEPKKIQIFKNNFFLYTMGR